MDESFVIGIEPSKWTFDAYQCYKRGCNCNGCFIQKTYIETLKNRCAMKYCVKQLIRKFGLPNDLTLEQILMEEKNEERTICGTLQNTNSK